MVKTVVDLDEALSVDKWKTLPRYIKIIFKFMQHVSSVLTSREIRIYHYNDALVVKTSASVFKVDKNRNRIEFIRRRGNETIIDFALISIDGNEEIAGEIIEFLKNWLEGIIENPSLVDIYVPLHFLESQKHGEG